MISLGMLSLALANETNCDPNNAKFELSNNGYDVYSLYYDDKVNEHKVKCLDPESKDVTLTCDDGVLKDRDQKCPAMDCKVPKWKHNLKKPITIALGETAIGECEDLKVSGGRTKMTLKCGANGLIQDDPSARCVMQCGSSYPRIFDPIYINARSYYYDVKLNEHKVKCRDPNYQEFVTLTCENGWLKDLDQKCRAPGCKVPRFDLNLTQAYTLASGEQQTAQCKDLAVSGGIKQVEMKCEEGHLVTAGSGCVQKRCSIDHLDANVPRAMLRLSRLGTKTMRAKKVYRVQCKKSRKHVGLRCQMDGTLKMLAKFKNDPCGRGKTNSGKMGKKDAPKN